MNAPTNPAPSFILDFSVVLSSMTDPDSRKLLLHWRDGKIRPVVSRELLKYYLRQLEKAGCSTALMRWWSLWFTNSERSLYLPKIEKEPRDTRNLEEIYLDIAGATGVTTVVGFVELSDPALNAQQPGTFLVS
jgi:predicted nucleic acid-binding protein